ncbi:MAG: hypothetical protein ACRD1O_02915 [Terriglobia bacterium]
MSIDLGQIRELAQEKADENWRFRGFLKRQCDLKPDEIEHTSTYPIVYEVMEDLKKSLGFPRRQRL